jgi:hypothetical protein
MERVIFIGKKLIKQRGKEIVQKNMKAIFKFRIGAMNPFNNARVVIKVTFKPGIEEVELKIEDNHSVSIYGVEKFEIVKEKSSRYIENYLSISISKKCENKLEINTVDDDYNLYVGTIEKINQTKKERN